MGAGALDGGHHRQRPCSVLTEPPPAAAVWALAHAPYSAADTWWDKRGKGTGGQPRPAPARLPTPAPLATCRF